MGELIEGDSGPKEAHLALQGSGAFIELTKAPRARRHVQAGGAECRQGEFLTRAQQRPKDSKEAQFSSAANRPAAHATMMKHAGPDCERNELHHEPADVTEEGVRRGKATCARSSRKGGVERRNSNISASR